MAVHRSAPTNPLDSGRNILTSSKGTYTLPKKAKPSSTLPPQPPPEDQYQIMKRDVLQTLVVGIVILVLVVLAARFLATR